jgi:hypothetical protein
VLITILAIGLAVTFTVAGSASSAAPSLSFRIFARTAIPVADVLWTGRQFLYVANTSGEIAVSGPSGPPLRPFATLPQEVEEFRCLPSPGAHGFPGGVVFCHSPHGEIWRIGLDGKPQLFAKLPVTAQQDGALAFDTLGRFGYAMLAATGGSASEGGSVYAVRADGSVRSVGEYVGPGGADEIELAPARFGTASGQLLLAIDHDAAPNRGALLAMRPDGTVRRLVPFPEGINPIVLIGRGDAPRGTATAGLYLTDTNSTNVLLAPAAQLSDYSGSLIVGAEKTAHLWLVSPAMSGFRAVRVRSNLRPGAKWNLEGAVWVG